MSERIEEFNAVVRDVKVIVRDDMGGTARILLDYESERGACFWFLPVTERVVTGLCKIGEVDELNKLKGRGLVVVRSENRLHGFRHLIRPSVALLGPDLFGAHWKEKFA